jgi:hypothetical protein
MYTPYTIIVKQEDIGIDLSMLDEALERAKGYYELIAENDIEQCVLRFNIKAFRNNYGLSDLLKMNLIFHAVHVGNTQKEQLKMELELLSENVSNITAKELIDEENTQTLNTLKVYDVILAGVEYGE